MEKSEFSSLLSKLNHLSEVLPGCWCKETSSEEDWTPENPPYGQCAVTALIVQDRCGGDIVNAKVYVPAWDREVSHYFNRIGGLEIDLTRHQFPESTEVPKGADKKGDLETTRAYVLSYPQTVERYKKLQERLSMQPPNTGI